MTVDRLPSRFDLYDAVHAYGEPGEVRGVGFIAMPADSGLVAALNDELGTAVQPFECVKVYYDVRTKSGMKYRVLSDYVTPAKSSHLQVVR